MVNAANRNGPRAGHYVATAAGYSAFIPAPLPPNPPLRIEGDLQQQLSEADRAVGRLDGSIYTLPNPDLFVYMYVRKEASVAIHGRHAAALRGFREQGASRPEAPAIAPAPWFIART